MKYTNILYMKYTFIYEVYIYIWSIYIYIWYTYELAQLPLDFGIQISFFLGGGIQISNWRGRKLHIILLQEDKCILGK